MSTAVDRGPLVWRFVASDGRAPRQEALAPASGQPGSTAPGVSGWFAGFLPRKGIVPLPLAWYKRQGIAPLSSAGFFHPSMINQGKASHLYLCTGSGLRPGSTAPGVSGWFADFLPRKGIAPLPLAWYKRQGIAPLSSAGFFHPSMINQGKASRLCLWQDAKDKASHLCL